MAPGDPEACLCRHQIALIMAGMLDPRRRWSWDQALEKVLGLSTLRGAARYRPDCFASWRPTVEAFVAAGITNW